jgi:pimeloyl-ACP methyl ester carboxylesterase
MRYSVWCGEEVDVSVPTGRVSAAGAKKDRLETVLARLDLSPVPLEVCRKWGVPPVPRRYLTSVRSSVPTLLISGEYDPYTPPSGAAAVSRTLSNSYVVTLRGMGHVPTQVWDQPCAMTVAAAFVEDPARNPARSTVGGCLASHGPPVFTTASEP